MFPSVVMLKEMNRRASGYAYDKLIAPRRGAHPAAKHLRNLASIANELLGRPLRPPDDVPVAPAGAERPAPVTAAAAPAVRAPVLVYFDGKDHRTLARVEELLRGRGYAYKVLDVSADEAERSWVTTAAKTSELPLVFVAGAPVGGWDAVLQADATGELGRLISSPG
jgi:glutaredoxin-related protein